MNLVKKYQNECRLIKLELGQEYLVSIWGSPMQVYKLIQPTERGFNFLNENTSKCVLKRHLYPSKKIGNNDMFYLHMSVQIISITNKKANSA